MTKIDRARLEKLVRVYHDAHVAAQVIGVTVGSIRRAAKRYGLTFRNDIPQKTKTPRPAGQHPWRIYPPTSTEES